MCMLVEKSDIENYKHVILLTNTSQFLLSALRNTPCHGGLKANVT